MLWERLDGGFAEHEHCIVLSRSLLPLRHADRARFFEEVRDVVMVAVDEDVAATRSNLVTAKPRPLKTDHFLPLAPFTRAHSVRRMADLLIWSRSRVWEKAGERLEAVEELARLLERIPEPLDLEGI